MIKINILEIPSEEQRYDTAGDWWVDEAGVLQIRTTAIDGDGKDSAFLIGLHEMTEAYLCMCRGITGKQVDDFDMAFVGDGEPGDDPKAPYRQEHREAMIIEHLVAHFLGNTGYGSVL